ncbi:MAG: outer membrane protein assembly factor BamE [Pseudomonadota bacterium]|nr:outer membrane protein assembly factor BamE [Pseudomonadota bacterium]
MTFRIARGATLALVLSAAFASGACTRIRDHQGHLLDQALVSAIQPGVDNRQSVEATLGRPTFTGQFSDRDWYYVSRDTKQLAFSMPKPDQQTVLHVRFNEAGNVVAVERSGLERVASIDPAEGKTPTLGRNKSLFEEIFGNIGTVGAAGRQGETADNPR